MIKLHLSVCSAELEIYLQDLLELGQHQEEDLGEQGLFVPFEEGIPPTDEVEVGVTSAEVVKLGVVSPATAVDVDGLEDWSSLSVG